MSVANEIKENISKMQFCYTSNETIEFDVPVEYRSYQV